MNRYLLEVDKYFGGTSQFEVDAVDKMAALINGRTILKSDPKYAGGTHKSDTLRVIKKIKE